MTGDDEVAAALDANFAELIRWYAPRPAGEVVEAGDVMMCSTRLPFRSINRAVALDLDPATADQRISEVGRWFEARGLPWRWLVGPTSEPLDLGERLTRAGFELVSNAAGMALDLVGFEPEPAPAGVEIVAVDDLAGLDAWEELEPSGTFTRRLERPCLARRSRPRAQQRGPVARLDRVARWRPRRGRSSVRLGRRRGHLQRGDRARGARSWHRRRWLRRSGVARAPRSSARPK
jgi:hypothetical protein